MYVSYCCRQLHNADPTCCHNYGSSSTRGTRRRRSYNTMEHSDFRYLPVCERFPSPSNVTFGTASIYTAVCARRRSTVPSRRLIAFEGQPLSGLPSRGVEKNAARLNRTKERSLRTPHTMISKCRSVLQTAGLWGGGSTRFPK